MTGPDLSVVIPTFNGGDLLAEQVDAVLSSADRFGGSVEVVIADNMSTDRSVERVVQSRSSSRAVVRMVLADGQRGVSHARNAGIAAASSCRIAICDADDVVSEPWVSAMAGVISPSTPYVTGPLDLDSLNPPWGREMRGRRVYEEPALFDGIVPFAHGCNIGLHRSLVDRIGGFDEEMTTGTGDDIEFGARVWRVGVPLTWEPDARVAYRYRPSLRDSYRQGRVYGAARRAVRSRAPYIPPSVDSQRHATTKRVLWLGRTAPVAIRDKEARARWVWVLSQLDGAARGRVGSMAHRLARSGGGRRKK